MFIRAYIYSCSSLESKNTFEELIKSINEKIKIKKFIKNELYWKDDSMYVVEVEIEFYEKLDEKNLKYFLNNISNKWLTFGNPIDEFLTSETMENCKILINNISMINVFY